MTPLSDAHEFAKSWEAGWNSHDLDQIMQHYSDDIVFRSRKAVPLTGEGEIFGKVALRHYWSLALAKQPNLRFSVLDVFEGHQMMVITYSNHNGVKAAETLYFDEEGRVWQAAACHAG